MNVTLSKDEATIREHQFTANIVLFWLKSDFMLTNKRLLGKQPNTLFGLIPLGMKQIDQPLKTISSITCSTKFFVLRFLIGGLLTLLGWQLMDNHSILGLFLLVFGVVNLINCYTATFIVVNNGGLGAVVYELSLLEKDKVQNFVTEINTQIAEL